MDNYNITISKNNEPILVHETAFPEFVNEDYSIRFSILELLDIIMKEHPSFMDDMYRSMQKVVKIIEDRSK